MKSRIEKRCPLCMRGYKRYDVAIPGVFRGFYYDQTKEKILVRPRPPDILYHYTSLEKMISIFNSPEKKLRAGHYSQMNDWAEVLLGLSLLEKRISLFDNNEIKDLLVDIEEIRNKKSSCYIFSLTEKKDLLSQWRAYTSSNGGVCIGFSSAVLSAIDNLYLVPCSYTNEDRKIDLKNIFDVAKFRATEEGKKILMEQEKKDSKYISYLLSFRQAKYKVEYTLEDLVEVATTVKDYGFFEEQEWRLVSWNNSQVQEINTPEGKRYIEFDFCPERWIQEIVISPHGDKQKIRNLLNYYQNWGLLSNNCTINESRIPFRG